jgi:hypothetical protein
MSFDAVNRRLYLAGTVVKREQAFNPFRALDAKNGAIISSFAPKIPGTIYDIADDGNGGNYIAGSFSLVNGQALNALVHCNADGSVDSTFAPVIEGLINAIKLSPDKGTLYLGGTFTKVGGVTYNNIAAVDARTGAAITTFNPNANGRVRTMALSASGGILYFGGTFTKVDGVTYNRIAAVATSTGAALSTFNPNADGEVHALVLTSDESTLYMGGTFGRAGGLSRYGVAKIATSNGNVNSSFIPNFTVLSGIVSSHGVFSLALSANEGTLYLGGSFHLEGASNDSLSAVSTSNGARIATFSPKISGTNGVSEVWGMALAPTGGTLYISGWFSFVGDSATRVAAVSSSTGAILTTYKWPDKLITYNNSVVASYPLLFETEIKLAISPNGAALYLLGAYAKSTGVANFITKSLNPTTGTLASPFITTNGPVSAIAGSADGATLYVGGNFLNIGTEVYNTLAAVTTASATLVRSFKPNPNYPSEVKALALSADGGTLYLGGSFTSLGGVTTNIPSAPNNFYTNGGVTYNKLGAVSTSTAAAVSTFNPNLGTGMVYAMALSPDGGTLYIGGSFVTVGGATYNRVAAVNTANGAVITSFNPNVDNTVNALALSTDGTILYMGGSFTTIAGASYKRVAAVSTANGAAISSFNPNVDNTVNALALSADGGTLYLGGAFTTVGGAAASMLAGVATANGTVISGITPAVVGTVNVLLRSGSTLFVGGTFGAIYGDVAYPGSFISSGF